MYPTYLTCMLTTWPHLGLKQYYFPSRYSTECVRTPTLHTQTPDCAYESMQGNYVECAKQHTYAANDQLLVSMISLHTDTQLCYLLQMRQGCIQQLNLAASTTKAQAVVCVLTTANCS